MYESTQATVQPLTHWSFKCNFAVEPLLPLRVTNTFASVPAPLVSPVTTSKEYSCGGLGRQSLLSAPFRTGLGRRARES